MVKELQENDGNKCNDFLQSYYLVFITHAYVFAILSGGVHYMYLTNPKSNSKRTV